jgi:hypothetical protein
MQIVLILGKSMALAKPSSQFEPSLRQASLEAHKARPLKGHQTLFPAKDCDGTAGRCAGAS